MALREFLLPWDSQPQEAVGINGESPYAQNLVTCIPLHPQWGMRNLVTNTAVTRTGLSGTVAAPHGLYPSFGTSNYCDFDSPAAITSGTQPVTIAWDQYPVATSAYSTVLNWKPAGATYAFVIYQSAAVAGYYFAVGARLSGSLNTASYQTAIGPVTDARLDRYVLVCTEGTNGLTATYRLFRNGVLQTQIGGTSFGLNTATSARIGSLETGSDVFEGAIGNFCIWNEAFSDAKAAAYDPQRWQLFAPRAIWVPVSAGGSPDGNASAAPSSSTLTAPTATGSGSAQASSAPAGSTLTAPTATASASALASGALAGASLTAPTTTATGTTAGNATATGAPAGLTLTAPTATATGSAQASGAPTGTTLTAPTGTASSAGHATASGAFSGATLTAPTGTATGTAKAFAAFMAAVLTAPTATASNGEALVVILGSLAGSRPANEMTRSNKQTATRANVQTATRTNKQTATR